jgi:hypothetical protein
MSDVILTVQTILAAASGASGATGIGGVIAGYVLLGSIVLPVVANLIAVSVILYKEMIRNSRFSAWGKDSPGILGVAAFLGCLDIGSLQIMNSRAFGLNSLSAPVSKDFENHCGRVAIITIILEVRNSLAEAFFLDCGVTTSHPKLFRFLLSLAIQDLPQFGVGLYFVIQRATLSLSLDIPTMVLLATWALSLLFALVSRLVYFLTHTAERASSNASNADLGSDSKLSRGTDVSLGVKESAEVSTSELLKR